MKKLLSIVIPTYNRKDVLEYTLSYFYSQIERNIDDVEFIICNNASTDGTEISLKNIHVLYPYIEIVNYNDHVDIGDSIKRTASNANGKYLLLWSDDDIPSPFLLDYVLEELKLNPDVGCLCYNRIEGISSRLSPIYNLFLTRKKFYSNKLICEDTQDFIEEYFCDMCFVSQNIILIDCWKEGLKKSSEGYYGYEWMAPLLFGLRNKKCIYLNYPLCIERHPDASNHSYLIKWQLYSWVGVPRLLIDLEKDGVILNWRRCYSKYHYFENDNVFIHDLFHVCIPNMEIYLPYKEEIKMYQSSSKRKFFVDWALTNNKIKRNIARICFKLLLFRDMLKNIIKKILVLI